MLLDAVIKKIELDLPSLNFIVNQEKHIIVIPPIHEEFGNIEIDNDNHEVTLYIGKFTHCHFGCSKEDLSDKEKAEEVAEDVIEFLSDIFDKKVVMYGSHNGGGGCEYRDEQETDESRLDTRQWWLWSGPISKETLNASIP